MLLDDFPLVKARLRHDKLSVSPVSKRHTEKDVVLCVIEPSFGKVRLLLFISDSRMCR